jgi:hypothetical protein
VFHAHESAALAHGRVDAHIAGVVKQVQLGIVANGDTKWIDMNPVLQPQRTDNVGDITVAIVKN